MNQQQQQQQQQQQEATIAIANINKRPRTPPTIEEMEAQDQDQSAKRPKTPPTLTLYTMDIDQAMQEHADEEQREMDCNEKDPKERENIFRCQQSEPLETYEPDTKFHAKFYNACKYGDVEVVERMLELRNKHFNPQFFLDTDNRIGNCYSNSYMALAAKGGYLKIVDMLLKDKRIDVTIHDTSSEDYANSPLAIACERGDLEMAKLIVESGRIEVSVGGNIALSNACISGNTELVEWLLKNGGVCYFDKRNCESALNIVCEDGRFDMLELFFEHSQDSMDFLVNVLEESEYDNWSDAMRRACRYGRIGMIKFMLQKRTGGDDINLLAYFHESIVEACEHGQIETMKLLLKHYQKISVPSSSDFEHYNLHAPIVQEKMLKAYSDIAYPEQKLAMGNFLNREVYKGENFAKILGVKPYQQQDQEVIVID